MESAADYQTENTNPMAHEQALEIRAVERYLLGGLTPEQRTRFENHYFECRICAIAVAAGQHLIRELKPAREAWWRRLAFPVLVPALAASIAIVGIESYSSIAVYKSQVAALAMPQANTVIVAHPQEKGDLEKDAVNTDSISLEMVLPNTAASPFYRVEIRGASKQPISEIVPSPKDSRLSLHLTRQNLGSGSFKVTVYGLEHQTSGDGAKVETYYFGVQ